MNVIVRHGVVEETKSLFEVEITEHGEYIAVRNETPMFVVSGSTIVEAARRAQETFDSYERMQAKERAQREGSIACTNCGGRGWRMVGLGGDSEECGSCRGYGRA